MDEEDLARGLLQHVHRSRFSSGLGSAIAAGLRLVGAPTIYSHQSLYTDQFINLIHRHDYQRQSRLEPNELEIMHLHYKRCAEILY